MQLTLRERRRLKLLAALWALLTAMCAISGPFGTLDTMPVLGRLGYWALVVGLSISGSVIPLATTKVSGWAHAFFWVGYVLLLASVIHTLNSIIFNDWQGVATWMYLVGIVGATTVVVHGVLYLVGYAVPQTQNVEATSDPAAGFLRRLPVGVRGTLLRIEAQDHYLNVVTEKGSALILMRLGEAVGELDGVSGLQVHRSHWVAVDAVTAHRRDKGRDVLTVSDGTEIPVARSRQDAVRAVGLM